MSKGYKLRVVKIKLANGEIIETDDRKTIINHLDEFNKKIIEDERWVQVIDYNNYEISDYGRARNKKFNKFLKPYFNNSIQFTFHENYKNQKRSIANLVFKHFKPEEYKEGINYKHIDGDIFNNHISNIKQSAKEDLRVIKRRSKELIKEDKNIESENIEEQKDE
jgi:hypothetical protein